MSPIEQKMAAELYLASREYWWGVDRQVRIGRYTADFMVTAFGDSDAISLIVECDGHDYHERTKEQAAHDRRRDRYLFAVHGLTTVRFTGSEIHRNANACVAELVEIFHEMRTTQSEAFRRGIDVGWMNHISYMKDVADFDKELG